jgi:hypothetical protein
MGSKPKQELIEQCSKLGLPIDGTVQQLTKRIKDFNSRLTTEMHFTTPIETTVDSSHQQLAKNYFVQLNVLNFQYYLNYAVILPVQAIQSEIYKTENRKRDWLTVFSDYVILSSKPVSAWNPDEVMVEINIEGLTIVEISEGVYYSADPIPISRIISAIFPSDQCRQKFLIDINISSDSYFPGNLCFVSDKRDFIDFNPTESLPGNRDLPLWRDRLNRFDRILGMFSFMRTAGIICSDKENIYQEYSVSFFSALHRIYYPEGQPTERDFPIFKYLLYPTEIEGPPLHKLLLQKILHNIYSGREFGYEAAKNLLSEVISSGILKEDESDINNVMDIFSKLERQQIIFRDVLASDLFRKHYPLLGLLFLSQFSNRAKSHTDKQAVRNVFFSNTNVLAKGMTEFLMALLGLYYGYGNLVKADTNVRIEDPIFSRLGMAQQTIKIRDFTYIERILVETCFDFSKSGHGIFRELSMRAYNATLDNKPSSNTSIGQVNYIDRSILKYGTNITIVEKRSKLSELIDLIMKSYPSSIPYKSLVLHHVLQSSGISKQLMITLLHQAVNSLDYNDLKKLIEVDLAQNNRK